jgi:hypothetical protein
LNVVGSVKYRTVEQGTESEEVNTLQMLNSEQKDEWCDAIGLIVAIRLTKKQLTDKEKVTGNQHLETNNQLTNQPITT